MLSWEMYQKMALRNNQKWLSSREEKDFLEKKINYFKIETKREINGIYQKGSFCSGFAAQMVIVESEKEIFAISDELDIYINKMNRWVKYEKR